MNKITFAQNKVSDNQGLKEEATGIEGQRSDEGLLECAKECAEHTMRKGWRRSGCCNFEWSHHEMKCKLHHDCITSKPQNKDFFTCRKEGDWPCVFFGKKFHTPTNLGPGVGEHCNLDLFLDFTRPWLFGRIRAARWQRQGNGDYQRNEQSGRSSRVSKYFVYLCYEWLTLHKIWKIILTILFFFSGAGKNVFPLRTAAHTNIVRAQKCAI